MIRALAPFTLLCALGTAHRLPPEAPAPETEAVSSPPTAIQLPPQGPVVPPKDIQNEIHNPDKYNKENKSFAKPKAKSDRTFGAAPCQIRAQGKLFLAKDPKDILATTPMDVVFEPNAMIILNATGEAKGKLYERFLWETIEMPLLTIPRERSCWVMTYHSIPHVLCATGTKERNDWMVNITKAHFCASGRVRPKPAPALESGEAVQLPPHTTKAKRWKAVMDSLIKAAATPDPDVDVDEKQMPEISIQGLLTGEPKVLLNGNPLVF